MNRLARLQTNWVYGGALAGVLLLVLSPLLTRGLSPAGTAVFLGLVAYMLHQYEEHDDDRFRRFVNDTVLHGRQALSIAAVFVINIFGVWATMALDLWATEVLSPGWAVLSGWFLLVNALAHLGQALVLRRPNPGLWTGLVLFIPVGLWTLTLAAPLASAAQQAVSLLIVLAIHAAIIRHVRKALA